MAEEEFVDPGPSVITLYDADGRPNYMGRTSKTAVDGLADGSLTWEPPVAPEPPPGEVPAGGKEVGNGPEVGSTGDPGQSGAAGGDGSGDPTGDPVDTGANRRRTRSA